MLNSVLENYRELYLTNVWFRHSVDLLIPYLIDIMAIAAEQKQKELDERT